MNRFFSPIQLLVQQYNTFQQGRASVFKLRDLLENEPSVLEAPDAVELPPIRGEIRFDHVSFGYDPAVPVLHDVDLTIEPGETVAFVGATGAGKSTMAKLVTRFYDPTAGRVLIDGYDLQARDARVAAQRSSVSCPRSRSSSPGPSATTSRSPGRARPTTRCGTPSTRWASTSSCTGCPTGSTRRSTSGASRCPRASAS